MIKSIHKLLVPARESDYRALLDFFDALGLARGESWDGRRVIARRMIEGVDHDPADDPLARHVVGGAEAPERHPHQVGARLVREVRGEHAAADAERLRPISRKRQPELKQETDGGREKGASGPAE